VRFMRLLEDVIYARDVMIGGLWSLLSSNGMANAHRFFCRARLVLWW
jgi:hypothetical protein